jgi:dihydroxyacetone kinase-like predicted kinase
VIGTSLDSVAETVIRAMLQGGGEMVTLVVGSGAPVGLPEQVREAIRRRRLDVEVVIYEGGQPDYPLLIGVE